MPKILKGGTLSIFSTSIVPKHQKIEGGLFSEKKISGKKSHNAKNTERGDPFDFFNIHCSKTSKN